ncbi:MAG: hypothetical protein M1817_003001 [Caeruleum heppii]|nr:MAG: hypothetical protein M1817_003001 [Caeruleum heppii]
MDSGLSSYPGSLHHYAPRLVAFEYALPSRPPPQNSLLFIGGLSDGLCTVSYLPTLAKHLPPTWCLVQILLSSSYTGWGISSIANDAKETAQCVAFLEKIRPGGKVVLMGHSTGCQDTLEYLTGKGHKDRIKIDGAILQSSVSDREARPLIMPDDVYEKSVALAKDWMTQGKGEDTLPAAVMPGFFGATVSARRWLSLASPDHDGEDDMFSSDLTDEQLQRTFGSIGKTPLCILYSGDDEFVPPEVNKLALVKRWVDVAKAGGTQVDEQHSGIIDGANHGLTDVPKEVLDRVLDRVVGFVNRLDHGDFLGEK